jgi:hypothetical protein
MTGQSPTETPVKVNLPTVTESRADPTNTPTLNPTPTKTKISTPTQTPTLSITGTPTPFIVEGSPIQFSNIQNGIDVEPRMVLRGTYVGLNPGNSIHVLLQPINGCSTLSILNEDDYLVKEQSGEWDIDVVFGEGEELNYPEQYNIRVAVAQNDEARKALKSERYRTCFDLEDLPLGVFYFRVLVVNVQRGAYVQIDEERLLFSSSEGEGFPYDIATTKLDGTDFRLLTNTTHTSEVQPNLCSANQKIVFGEFAAKEIAVGVLWIMNSDGSDAVELLYEEDMRYEEPVWSPDCQYIAFGSRERTSDRVHIKFLSYKDSEKTVFDLGEGQYPTWIPDSHQLVFNRLGNPSGVSSFLTTNLDECDIDYSTNKSECKILPYPDEMTPRGKQPAISLDGRLLAYASFPIEYGASYYQILKVLDLVTGMESNVTQPVGESQDWQPVWGLESNPDMIYFESKRIFGYLTIWRINYDGADLLQITQGSQINSELSIGYMKAFLPVEE